MAEAILAVLLIVAGAGCALLSLLSLFANAMGSVTAPGSERVGPSIILALLAVLGIGGGIAIFIF